MHIAVLSVKELFQSFLLLFCFMPRFNETKKIKKIKNKMALALQSSSWEVCVKRKVKRLKLVLSSWKST